MPRPHPRSPLPRHGEQPVPPQDVYFSSHQEHFSHELFACGCCNGGEGQRCSRSTACSVPLAFWGPSGTRRPPLWHGVSVPAHTAPLRVRVPANAHPWPHPAPTAPLPLSGLNTFPTWQHPRVGAERAPLRGRAVSPTQPGCPRARPAAHGPRGNPGAGACGDAAASPWQRVISRPRAWGRGIWGPRVLLGGVGAPPGGGVGASSTG